MYSRYWKSWWYVFAALGALLFLLIVTAVIFRGHIPLDERSFEFLILGAMFLILLSLSVVTSVIIHRYIRPLRKLAEEARIVTSANPSHRINIRGGNEVKHLVKAINDMAQRYEELKSDIWHQIQHAMARAEEEKSILAAIVAELPEGIFICNAEGQILLYNKQARRYFEGEEKNNSSLLEPCNGPWKRESGYIGLGRSVFGLIDKTLVVQALDEIAGKLERAESRVTAHFIAVGNGHRLLRVEAVPVLNHGGELTGFVLIIQDIIKQIETDTRLSFLLQSLTQGVRDSMKRIRTAIEAILDQPEMDHLQREGFKKMIHREILESGAVLDEAALDYSGHVSTMRPLVRMLGKDLLTIIRQQAEENFGMTVKIIPSEEQNWIKIDCYSFLLAVLFILNRLQLETNVDTFTCKLERGGKFTNIDLIWKGKPLKIQTLREWESEVVVVGREGIPSTLREVIKLHGAKMWPATWKQAAGDDLGLWPRSYEPTRDRSAFRLSLPDVETPEPDTLRKTSVVLPSRPEFYDFDLFNQPGQTPELDNRLLAELTYTVFDTETTGLFPQVGDEIISLGAVRIVNGRLLREEVFDQLVNPRRYFWQKSVEVHGIQPEMLESQPAIDDVLPLFHRFVEDSILVAHNAAFDMCMLQMKEESSGITFINPVLDTLLLSAVVHPAQEEHTLEAIAARLGVSIVGRHTALGDALATGEIFLKLVPLLSQMGIRTLGEARMASERTFYARIKY
ncbi:MAG: exonuclease domain-containing protein [Syntrophales bacterium]|nr:exonuclease domain-containing protein [Syntrophales bacterium]MCK9527982.1 exonuclease domain-containing protein [Syntrophales bacterium]MDX9921441.1 exonuclease domain-containing protein [Syntrophales bacterium]